MGDKLFSDAEWERIAATLSSGLSLSAERSARLRAGAAAKLIAALPYLAGCREPERCAVAHLAAFVVGGSGGPARALFDHRASDDYDVMARLSAVSWFEGGDPAILGRGMKLLAIAMVAGYRRDAARDAAAGEYNPVGSGAWDADALIRRLAAEAESVPCPEMDALLTAADAANTFWD